MHCLARGVELNALFLLQHLHYPAELDGVRDPRQVLRENLGAAARKGAIGSIDRCEGREREGRLRSERAGVDSKGCRNACGRA